MSLFFVVIGLSCLLDTKIFGTMANQLNLSSKNRVCKIEMPWILSFKIRVIHQSYPLLRTLEGSENQINQTAHMVAKAVSMSICVSIGSQVKIAFTCIRGNHLFKSRGGVDAYSWVLCHTTPWQAFVLVEKPEQQHWSSENGEWIHTRVELLTKAFLSFTHSDSECDHIKLSQHFLCITDHNVCEYLPLVNLAWNGENLQSCLLRHLSLARPQTPNFSHTPWGLVEK